jgi:hypothetical protein
MPVSPLLPWRLCWVGKDTASCKRKAQTHLPLAEAQQWLAVKLAALLTWWTRQAVP